jgi:hypothetical protein
MFGSFSEARLKDRNLSVGNSCVIQGAESSTKDCDARAGCDEDLVRISQEGTWHCVGTPGILLGFNVGLKLVKDSLGL